MTTLLSADALAGVRRVRVGTANQPKIAAARDALALYCSDLEVEGVAVESGVPEQPVGFAEIASGARNRARAAFASAPCDLAIGIEDGLVLLGEVEHEPFNIGCAVVTDGRRESPGLSSAFSYPAACARPALERREPIGELFDLLWSQRSGEVEPAGSGRSVGNIGKLSLGRLTRAEYARHAVLCALVRFIHPDLYFAETAGEAEDCAQTRAAVSEEAG